MTEITNPREVLEAMTIPALKNLINRARLENSLPFSWQAPRTNDKAELIDHIDQMCNEFDLRVMPEFSLKASTSRLSSE